MDRPSVVGLLTRIVGNLETIVRTEFRLLKRELLNDAGDIGRASVLVLAGAALGQLALGCLLLSAIYLIGMRLPFWAAALIVALVSGGVAAMLVVAGGRRLSLLAATRDKGFTLPGEPEPWTSRADISSR